MSKINKKIMNEELVNEKEINGLREQIANLEKSNKPKDKQKLSKLEAKLQKLLEEANNSIIFMNDNKENNNNNKNNKDNRTKSDKFEDNFDSRYGRADNLIERLKPLANSNYYKVDKTSLVAIDNMIEKLQFIKTLYMDSIKNEGKKGKKKSSVKKKGFSLKELREKMNNDEIQ